MALEAFRRYPLVFTDFKKCLSWTNRLMDRNQFSIRRKPHDQKSLSEGEMGILKLDFVQHLRLVKADFEISDKMTINMDEIGLYFDMHPNRTISQKG